jgi:hypothetical protein
MMPIRIVIDEDYWIQIYNPDYHFYYGSRKDDLRVADHSLHRLIEKAKHLGLVEPDDGFTLTEYGKTLSTLVQ